MRLSICVIVSRDGVSPDRCGWEVPVSCRVFPV